MTQSFARSNTSGKPPPTRGVNRDGGTDSAQDLVLAARAIQEFVQGITQEHFGNDFKTQCAVVQQITVLGEATKRLGPNFRTKPFQVRILQKQTKVTKIRQKKGNPLLRVFFVSLVCFCENLLPVAG
jgi:hypothetical protein